jgi:hypothetical protein
MDFEVTSEPPSQSAINEEIARYRAENIHVATQYNLHFRRGSFALVIICATAFIYSITIRKHVGAMIDLPVMLTVLSLITCCLVYGYIITSARNGVLESNETAIRELQPCTFSDALTRFLPRNSVLSEYIAKINAMNRSMCLKEYMVLYHFAEHYTHYVVDGEVRQINTPVIEQLDPEQALPPTDNQPIVIVKRKISIN